MLSKIKAFCFQLFLFLCGTVFSIFYGEPLPVRKSRKVSEQNVKVIIIGAGISGIAIAKRLNDIGLTGYTILEQGADLGGTWFWNKVSSMNTMSLLHNDDDTDNDISVSRSRV